MRNIVQATLVSQGFETVALVVSFVAVPLYLAYLGAERYGLYLTAQAWAGYLTLGNAGTSQSTLILVGHASGREDSTELSRIVRTSFVLTGMASILVLFATVGAFLALSEPSIAHVLKLEHAEVPGLMLAVGAQVVAVFFTSIFYDVLIGLQHARRSSVLQGITRVVSQLVALVVAASGGTVGQIAGSSALVTLAAGAVAASQTRRAHPEAFGAARVTREQLLLQLHTGLKSFGLQVGYTLTGTAPTLALATVAGPAAVPFFAVPARLFGIGTGLVTSFCSLLQPAFGEAYARSDLDWIRRTLREVWEKTLLATALGAALLTGIGSTFVFVWTAGKLVVSTEMLVSVAIAGAPPAALAPVKFLLAGINRHREAAIAEITGGVLALIFAFAAVGLLSPEAVGLGVLLGAASTTAWLLPKSAASHLGMTNLLPARWTLGKIALVASAVYAAGRWAPAAVATLGADRHWVALLVSATSAAATAAVGVTAFRLIDWSSVLRRYRVERT
jgi:O-antigen/teichoic acid export membrane protein